MGFLSVPRVLFTMAPRNTCHININIGAVKPGKYILNESPDTRLVLPVPPKHPLGYPTSPRIPG